MKFKLILEQNTIKNFNSKCLVKIERAKKRFRSLPSASIDFLLIHKFVCVQRTLFIRSIDLSLSSDSRRR